MPRENESLHNMIDEVVDQKIGSDMKFDSDKAGTRDESRPPIETRKLNLRRTSGTTKSNSAQRKQSGHNQEHNFDNLNNAKGPTSDIRQ